MDKTFMKKTPMDKTLMKKTPMKKTHMTTMKKNKKSKMYN